MMLRLLPHPDAPPVAITSVTAEAVRGELRQLRLRYHVRGNIQALSLPPTVRYSSRHDNLWRTTCFEAFLRNDGERSYFEFNFAPSTGWAAYRFTSRRQNMRDAPLRPPEFEIEQSADHLALEVALDLSDQYDLSFGKPWRLNLTAVIEELDGTKSYWALAHPPAGAADFHHPDCFALELPAPHDA
jgi:hypothetical protein